MWCLRREPPCDPVPGTIASWAQSASNGDLATEPAMIRHIVFFSAKDKAHVEKMLEGLSILTAIPHARRLEVASNRKTDQLANEIDVVVYGEFDNEAELAAYKAHELYQESIKRVRPLRELRLAADYDASTAVRFTPSVGER